ncbi:MarR family transcriptional regulator, negative regulator of the multidrug operon emrRAB [Luteibacter sp. UNC138MFCol5.1]|uniref:MarR family winged helix-turn-helix transcriptional regulator n=1 Tax=Luteibacter sp. UNC138MFCol5.1 TaxID=1502774 RepID=UPI0008D187F5|nr:MarR family transcriptional regulator [Luteibacter sp. UNC138MFCol5.1]SEO73949.1 MarR family transcriptional regulator, negative regulator of the multidrug operon emrRAB [Luteibacter sp. UNC138MFCol5.1]
MSSLKPCVDALYEGVDRVAERIPELPRCEVFLVRLLMLNAGALLRDFESKLKPHGMNDSDFRTLMMLYASEEGATPGELCLLAEQKPTNMTRIANALVKRDFISRSHATHDRRQVVLRITAAGRRFVNKLLPPMFPPLVESFACFSATERKTFERLLKKLALHLDPSVDADATP